MLATASTSVSKNKPVEMDFHFWSYNIIYLLLLENEMTEN